jgi:predicted lipoprotein with Yx(FWY)xxD motif
MKFSRLLFSSFVFGLVLLLAACGGSSTTSGGNGTSNSNTSVTGATIRTASIMLDNKTVTILTNSKGMTLYYYKPDTATTAACTGGCTKAWPPLLANGSSAPASATHLPGTLTVQTDANGKQIEYNHHLLYTYSGDTAPGQLNGEGINNQWFVATTDLADNAGSGSSSSSSGGGYGSGGGY